jgi:RNA polymerase sigma-70 factor (ECF subfamily)
MLKSTHKPPLTLGDVLYAKSSPAESEQAWVKLVHAVAAGDQLALHALYERAKRPVFTLMLRLTANPAAAEDLTLDVFLELWRLAPDYNAAKGTVLAWIMSRARARAIDHLAGMKRSDGASPVEPVADPQDVLKLHRQSDALRTALATLTPDERQAIETTFFAGHTHAEATVQLNRPFGTIKTLIRSALHKLQQALAAVPN